MSTNYRNDGTAIDWEAPATEIMDALFERYRSEHPEYDDLLHGLAPMEEWAEDMFARHAR